MKSIFLFSFRLSRVFAFSIWGEKYFMEQRGMFAYFSLFAIAWRMPIEPIGNRANILSDVISLFCRRPLMWLQMSGACRASTPTQQWLAYCNDECDARTARSGVDA